MKSRIVQSQVLRGRTARVLAALAFAGLFAACSDSTGPDRLATLTISPASATLAINGTQPFTVVGTDSDGNTLRVDAEVWSVVAGGGTINASTGLFTAGTVAGTFTNTVRVTCNGITSFATVIVTPGAPATIVVAPDTTLVVGATAQFRAVVRDANGNVLTVTLVWSVINPVAGNLAGTIIPTTGLFTAGNTAGSFPNSVQACVGTTTLCDQANVTVIAGPAASIVVAPDTTLVVGATAQFRAVVRDAFNNIVTVPLVWSVINPVAGNLAGTIIPTTGLFTAGNTIGTFPNSVQACVGTTTLCDQANVTVIPPTPPAVSGGFTVLAEQAVSCTLGSIIGDVGTNQAPPTGIITPSCIPVTTGTVHIPEGDAASVAAYNNFLTAYIARTPQPGDCDPAHTLTGSLAGITLAPGVWCFSAGATLTGLLTLDGPSTGLWLFKIGTTAPGSLSGTDFIVTMAGAALPCNVTWWVRDAATMVRADLKGTVLAGTAISLTDGTFNGNMWAGASGIGDATIVRTAVTGCP